MPIRVENKYKILTTLKNAELSIDDIEMYTGFNRLDIVPLIQDLLRWGEVDITKEESYYPERKKRKFYTTTEKGENKIQYMKEKYGFTWKPKNA